MIKYFIISDEESLRAYTSIQELADFIHLHSIPYEDPPQAIIKCIQYVFSVDVGKGGYILLALNNNEIIGVSIINYSGMEEYIPNTFLVYIVVSERYRGQGVGSNMIKQIRESCNDAIALHVEYNNPAKHLYERLGFKSKYAEMRLERS